MAGDRTANFEFIRDERFRLGLECDYAEMNAAMAAQAWKAVHVLAGSVVEAVLIDYLVEAAATCPPALTAKDPLKLELAEAIDLCRTAGVLSERAAALSHVIRTYRNLIHPGRVARLSESADERSATVAVALTEIVVAEVGQSRADKLGYTADQLATKLEGDPAAASLLRHHLLPKLATPEREKLLLRVLPERYRALVEDPVADATAVGTLATAYRHAFNAAPDALKRRATVWLATVVREQPAPVVHLYEDAFFHADDLSWYTQDDAAIVVDHLLARLNSERSIVALATATDIGSALTPAQAATAVDAVVKEVVYGTDAALDTASREWLLETVKDLREPARIAAKRRHAQWVDLFEGKGQSGRVAQIESLLTALPASDLDDLPF